MLVKILDKTITKISKQIMIAKKQCSTLIYVSIVCKISEPCNYFSADKPWQINNKVSILFGCLLSKKLYMSV